VRWASLQFHDAEFPQDSVHKKLLKSIHFSPSYSKYKGGGPSREDSFLRHSVVLFRLHLAMSVAVEPAKNCDIYKRVVSV